MYTRIRSKISFLSSLKRRSGGPRVSRRASSTSQRQKPKGFKQQHFPSNFLRLVLVLNQVEVDIVVVEVQEKENEVDNNNNFKKVEK